jgi:hypothetical protein
MREPHNRNNKIKRFLYILLSCRFSKVSNRFEIARLCPQKTRETQKIVQLPEILTSYMQQTHAKNIPINQAVYIVNYNSQLALCPCNLISIPTSIFRKTGSGFQESGMIGKALNSLINLLELESGLAV